MSVESQEDKLFYSIREVAEMLNTSQSQLRFWEKEFDMLKPKKNRKGNRQFTVEDIELLRMIHYLVKEQGYTLAGANDRIKSDMRNSRKRIDVIQTLKELRSFLVEIKGKLE